MRWTAVLVLGLLLSACAVDDPVVEPIPPQEMGQQVYQSYCGLCHGANGEGNINALDASPLNADSETYLLMDEQIRDIIRNGTLETGGQMPPLSNQLSEAQISAVADYLTTLWTAEQQAAHASANNP